MNAGRLEIASLITNWVELGGVGKNPARFVALDGAVLRASFPKLVADLDIFLGDLIAFVVVYLPGEANILGAAVEIRGDNVPGRAALGQMIEGREAAREGVGVFERHGRRQSKAQIASHGRHGRYDLERVVDRNLSGVPDSGVDVAMEDVIGPEDVGDEDGVEFPAFENPRETRPVVERSTPPARAKMKP